MATGIGIHIGLNRVDPAGYRRCAIVLPGSELPPGGGGPRCMTMPLRRAPVS